MTQEDKAYNCLLYTSYTITTDKALMRVEDIHQWLSTEAYWCKKIPFDVVKTAFDHSYCIGILKNGKQIGYARFVTDYSVFAYLADVYIEEAHRGIGPVSYTHLDVYKRQTEYL